LIGATIQITIRPLTFFGNDRDAIRRSFDLKFKELVNAWIGFFKIREAVLKSMALQTWFAGRRLPFLFHVQK